MRPPRRNLPPDAEPWGRWVEDNVTGLGQSATSSDQGTANGLGAINGALQQLSNQIASVATAVTAATTAVTKLASLQTYADQSPTQTLATPNNNTFVNGTSGPSVTFTPADNTNVLVTISASRIGHTITRMTTGGAQVVSALTFEVSGNPTYAFGLNTTTSQFGQDTSFTQAASPSYSPAVISSPMSRTFLVTGLTAGVQQTINLRLRGRSTSTAATHQADDITLVAQIIPGPGF